MRRSRDRPSRRPRSSATGRYTWRCCRPRRNTSSIDSIFSGSPSANLVVVIYYSKEFINHVRRATQTQVKIKETQGKDRDITRPSLFGFSGWIIIQLMQGGQRERTAQEGPFEMLKTQVYPVINQIILKLIDHIVKSEEVSKHEERLKRKKIIDQLERKYIERDIQKEEMGSDYEQSDDEELHKALGMQKEAVETLIRKRIAKHRSRHLDDDSDNQLQGNVFNPMDFIINELKEHQAKRAK